MMERFIDVLGVLLFFMAVVLLALLLAPAVTSFSPGLGRWLVGLVAYTLCAWGSSATLRRRWR